MSRPRATRRPSRRPASSRPASPPKTVLNVAGREVPVSRLDKVFYPQTGFTKAQVIDYYIRISPVLLPHLHDRPLTLKRYPDGVEGGFFYEKRCPPYRPPWIQTAPVWSEHNDAIIQYCLANDLPSIIWAANLGDLELHTFLALADKINQPTMMVFDLDPGPPASIIECAQVAEWLQDTLAQRDLEAFPKTSGSKGLQLYVPLNTLTTFDATKSASREIAESLEREHPTEVVSKMSKKLRAGKVFVDWSQNDRHKTTVCVYSLRAKERPTVSTPVEWEEIRQALKKRDPAILTFTSDQVLERVQERGDLFAPVLKRKQKLTA